MKNWFLFFVFSSSICSCYYDVEDDLRQDEDCTTTTITYSEDIVAIVSNRCYKCHAANLNLGNVTL
ncbi:MAG: hypothetical protein IPL46_33040 [Saprospiraceae bacterium]|nr:hypothetical protein [Saprospiraceae bacterium]